MKSLNETVLSVVKESSGINESTHREIKKEIELKISKMSNDELKEFSKKHNNSNPQDVNRYMITNDVIDAEMKKRKISEGSEDLLAKFEKFAGFRIKPGRNVIHGLPVDIEDGDPKEGISMEGVDRATTTEMLKLLRKNGFNCKRVGNLGIELNANSLKESTSENPMHTEINTTALAIFDVLMSARFDKWYEGEFQSYVHGDSDEDDISFDFEKQKNKIMNSIIKLFG